MKDFDEIPLEPKPYHPTVSWMLGLAILALGGSIYLAGSELTFYVSQAVASDSDTSQIIEGTPKETAQGLVNAWVAAEKKKDAEAVAKIEKKIGHKLPSTEDAATAKSTMGKKQPAGKGGGGG